MLTVCFFNSGIVVPVVTRIPAFHGKNLQVEIVRAKQNANQCSLVWQFAFQQGVAVGSMDMGQLGEPGNLFGVELATQMDLVKVCASFCVHAPILFTWIVSFISRWRDFDRGSFSPHRYLHWEMESRATCLTLGNKEKKT